MKDISNLKKYVANLQTACHQQESKSSKPEQGATEMIKIADHLWDLMAELYTTKSDSKQAVVKGISKPF